MPRLFGVALFRLKMQRDIMFFERASRCLFFSDLSCYIWGGVLFITFVVNLYYIWVYYYICGRYYIRGFNLFLAIQCNRNYLVIKCEKHNLRKSGKLVKKNFENLRRMEWLSWIFSQAVEISKHHLLLRSVILKNKFVGCPWRVA